MIWTHPHKDQYVNLSFFFLMFGPGYNVFLVSEIGKVSGNVSVQDMSFCSFLKTTKQLHIDLTAGKVHNPATEK